MAWEWTSLIGPVLGFAGIATGGVIAKWKPKVDTHTAVVTDATTFAKLLLDRQKAQDERLDAQAKRIDELEDRELKRDELARQHIQWDWRVMRELHDRGATISEPPPLFVYNDQKGT